ncbi:Hypothetical Protein FCC1311_015632 [Hondaea fermentalgiana]|uniref:Uncharacterized protein n=1 Tax=Hondaea fermentalgiana TaxID=2315210 RepID=A0A2R5G465_9STRA|nr:Hypothetical Protein FCC1311_015632 [Hondaea fermentalgiana]|eukprot:GBG25345.1 Hypothetical Protein FCC1311_015632 [Hondaea fermentalgiana]
MASSAALRQLGSDLAPLETPFSKRSVQCTDVVSSFRLARDSWESGVEGEERRVATRREDMRKVMVELEAQQLLVEKLFEFQAQGHVQEGVLEVLQQGERAASQKASEARKNFDTLCAEVKNAAQTLTQLIGKYEEKRHTLVGSLDDLRRAVASTEALPQHEDLENLSPDACDKLIEDEVAEMQRLNERRKTLQDACATTEARVKELEVESTVLAEKTQKTETTLQAAEEQGVDDHTSEVEEKLAWVRELSSVLDSMSGMRVCDFQESSFAVEANGENLRLQLDFDPETSLLKDAKVSLLSGDNSDLPKALYARRKDLQGQILAEAVRRNDIRFLVRELRESARCGRALDREIAALRKLWPVSVADTEVIVTLPEGIVATFEVGVSYPRPFAAARLTSLEAFNGWKKSLIFETMEAVQAEQKRRRHELYTVTSLSQAVRDHLEAARAAQHQ